MKMNFKTQEIQISSISQNPRALVFMTSYWSVHFHQYHHQHVQKHNVHINKGQLYYYL